MGASAHRSVLQLAKTQHEKDLQSLEQLLGGHTVDDQGVEHFGLAWLYDQLKQWTTVRSVGGVKGKAKGSLPFNADAADFIGGKYWADPDITMGEATDAQLGDETNYQPGFELTMVALEQTVRRALRTGPAPRRPRPASPLEPLPAVTGSIEWLRSAAPSIVGDHFLLELVRSEAIRLATRARGMMLGSGFHAGRNQCSHCYVVDSVISDEDRAFCTNPFCRTPSGERHCWRLIDVDGVPTWLDVPEPSLRGRGQVSDEQLSRWADVEAQTG